MARITLVGRWSARLAIGVAVVARCGLAAESDASQEQASGLAPSAATVESEAMATDQAAALEVQRALGGPLTNQFPQLQPQPAATPWWKQFDGSLEAASPAAAPPRQGDAWPNWWTPAAPAVVPAMAHVAVPHPAQPQIAALRGTAAELEATANRLEEFDLYEQADAIRELAQRLRGDARARLARMRGGDREREAAQDPTSSSSTDRPGARVGGEPLTPNDNVAPQLLDGGDEASAVEWLRPELRETPVPTGPASDAEQADSDGQAGERSVLLGPAPE